MLVYESLSPGINPRKGQCFSLIEDKLSRLHVFSSNSFSVFISSMKLSSQYTDILLSKSTEKESDNKIAGEKTRENVENDFFPRTSFKEFLS